jgi:hypothetical protein
VRHSDANWRGSLVLYLAGLLRVELIATLPFALIRRWSRPGAHWGSQYQVGAAIFLSASKAWEKARSHREHGILLQILLARDIIKNWVVLVRLLT